MESIRDSLEHSQGGAARYTGSNPRKDILSTQQNAAPHGVSAVWKDSVPAANRKPSATRLQAPPALDKIPQTQTEKAYHLLQKISAFSWDKVKKLEEAVRVSADWATCIGNGSNLTDQFISKIHGLGGILGLAISGSLYLIWAPVHALVIRTAREVVGAFVPEERREKLRVRH